MIIQPNSDLIAELICISLISDVEHLFINLLSINIFFGETAIQVLCPFLIGFFLFFPLLSYRVYSSILDSNLLSDVWF